LESLIDEQNVQREIQELDGSLVVKNDFDAPTTQQSTRVHEVKRLEMMVILRTKIKAVTFAILISPIDLSFQTNLIW
jgi:hypothetical protein